jgi:hypothetical protein
MTLKQLEKLFRQEKAWELSFAGKCVDCQAEVNVLLKLKPSGEITITGGAVCDIQKNLNPETFMLKCDKCFESNQYFGQQCEVFSRVVGYLRPRSQYNLGKKAEFDLRKPYNLQRAIDEI